MAIMNCGLRSVSFPTKGFSWAVPECTQTENIHPLVLDLYVQGTL